MSAEQLGGLVRTILGIIGGFILSKGWISSDTWTWIAGGAAALIPAIWSFMSNRPSSIAASAQGIKGVNVVTSSGASASVIAAVNAAK